MKRAAKNPDAKAIAQLAADVRRSLTNSDNVSISAFNYGLTTGPQVIRQLVDALAPGIKVGSVGGFMGYIAFEKVNS